MKREDWPGDLGLFIGVGRVSAIAQAWRPEHSISWREILFPVYSGTRDGRGRWIEMGVIDFAHYPRLWEFSPDRDKARHKSTPRGKVLRTPLQDVRPASYRD